MLLLAKWLLPTILLLLPKRLLLSILLVLTEWLLLRKMQSGNSWWSRLRGCRTVFVTMRGHPGTSMISVMW